MVNIIGVKKLREKLSEYAEKVRKGHSFVVTKRSKPLFKIVPVEQERWEQVIDFTRARKGGVDIDELLSRL